MNISNVGGNDFQKVYSSEIKNQKTDAFQSKLEELMKKDNTNQTAEEKKKEDIELKNVCKQFESYFAKQIFSQMRQSVKQEGAMPESEGEKMFTDMLDDEYSKKEAEAGGLGLADMLYKQISKEVNGKNKNSSI